MYRLGLVAFVFSGCSKKKERNKVAQKVQFSAQDEDIQNEAPVASRRVERSLPASAVEKADIVSRHHVDRVMSPISANKPSMEATVLAYDNFN